MKKLILAIGAITTSISPMAAVISCRNNLKVIPWNERPVSVQGYAMLDSTIALNANVFQSTTVYNTFPKYLTENKYFKDKVNKIKKVQVPMQYSRSNLDEDFWRGSNGKNPYAMALSTYITDSGNNLYEFAKKDPIIKPVVFNFLDGIENQEYDWEIDNGSDSPKKLKFMNEGPSSNAHTDNGYNLFDMETSINKYANSLDNIFSTNDFSLRARDIVNGTRKHWKELNKLMKASNSSLKPIDFSKNKFSSSDDSAREKILFIFVYQVGPKMGFYLGSPSTVKDFLTKTHFTLPELSQTQISAMQALKTNPINSDGTDYKVKTKHPSTSVTWKLALNGAQTNTIFNEFAGDVDKLVISDYSSYAVKSNSTKIDYDFLNTVPLIKNLLKNGADINASNTIINDLFQVGPSSGYGGFQPIGQNAMIDQMATQWYGAKDGDPVLDWGFTS